MFTMPLVKVRHLPDYAGIVGGIVADEYVREASGSEESVGRLSKGSGIAGVLARSTLSTVRRPQRLKVKDSCTNAVTRFLLSAIPLK